MKHEFFFFLLLIFAMASGKAPNDFVGANNLFTVDFYRELKMRENGNFLLSPLSAEVVLALTQSGARGESADELRASLHLPSEDEKCKISAKNFLTSIQSNGGEQHSLYLANKIYVKKNLSLKDSFKKVATDVYRAETELIDFAKKEQAAKIINKWVEKQTQNKILDLIAPSNLRSSTVMVLINTLYFKGRWSDTFSTSETRKRNFYKTSNDFLQIDTMHKQDARFGYYENTELGAKFLRLPLDGGATLVIVLPNEKDGLGAIENRTDEIFSQVPFESKLINLALPKFKIETKIDVAAILRALGISKIFSSEADLSGIAGKKGDLQVSQALQKTFMEVDEEGIEAGAATFVSIVATSALIRQKPIEFIVDHPFIFYLRMNGAVLFAGRIMDPSMGIIK